MKYISSLILTLLLLSLGVKSIAQEEVRERRISLKLYSQIMADARSGDHDLAINFTPAVSLTTRKGNFHELELSDFSYDNNTFSTFHNSLELPVNSYKESEFRIGARYSFNFALLKKEKINVFVGAGINAYYQVNDLKSLTSLVFPQTNYNYGADFNITPRFIWNISDKLYLDINIPLSVVNTNFNTSYYDNPFVPEDYNNQTKMTNSTFPNKYTVNVGVGFKF